MNRVANELRSRECVAALVATLFTSAPLLSGKTIHIGNFRVIGGLVAMNLAYGLIDAAHNAWGTAAARRVVVTAAAARAAMWLVAGGITLLPGSAPPGWINVAHEGLRLFVVGEVVSFLLPQLLIDIPIFAWARRVGSTFWTRAPLSTMVSGAISFAVFVPLAFAGTGRPLLAIFLSGVIARTVFSIALTPLFAPIATWLEKEPQ